MPAIRPLAEPGAELTEAREAVSGARVVRCAPVFGRRGTRCGDRACRRSADVAEPELR
jgi:hypothetical protein